MTRDFNAGKKMRWPICPHHERVSGKGDLTRKRTVAGVDDTADSQTLRRTTRRRYCAAG